MDKLEFHYTRLHGSWLNMAEIELSVLNRQCLNRRLPDQDTLKLEIAAWSEERNQQSCSVNCGATPVGFPDKRERAPREAIYHRRCSHQTEATLSLNSNLMT